MPQFKIIRASAGSGKTFSLTREYLKLLFSETDSFMHILAVTFTNKATEEMKSRIISELYILSTGQPSKQLKSLTSSLGLPEKQIRSKAAVILKKLLHNYSKFSVSTIDSFFQRIIRNFTRELGIQGGYSIELDTEALLAEIIDRLLVNAETDKALLSWLTQFAESLIEKGENWNFRKSILNLGREIFREEYKCLDENVLEQFSDRGILSNYKAELYALSQQVQTTYKNMGKKAAALLKTHGLEVDDFSRKSNGPAGYLVKMATGLFRAPTSTAISAATSIDKWYTANSRYKSEITKIAGDELMPLMQQVIEFYNSNYRQYFTASVILKNLYTLGILADLSKLADLWCSENNSFLLPEAPVFLNKIIDDNDTPFIYEKAGCWYQHYMIDEFQDVSQMQWKNFKPLISNSLSQDYDNLAVGDAKQSIYRWRNSNWEILEKHITLDFLPGIMNPMTLNENWRSKENIISFNNRFFTSAAAMLQEDLNQGLTNQGDAGDLKNSHTITDLYQNVAQHAGRSENAGGYVRVDFVDKDEQAGFIDVVNSKLVKLLCDLLDKGYQLNDIAVLTRKNSEAKVLADFLLDYANTHPDESHRFEVISDEALRLGSSTAVNAVISLLRHIINPLDKTNNYLLISLIKNYINKPEPHARWIGPLDPENVQPKKNEMELLDEFFKLTHSNKTFSLIEIFEQLIRIFQLDQFSGEKVYLQALRDLIIEFSKKQGGDISRFVDYWLETGKGKSISAPAGQDALRILTLHKSKGLEFKITIIPYCTWDLISHSGTFLWCKSTVRPFDKLPTIPIAFSSQLKDTFFEADYHMETCQQYIDNLNLLYVAFTRAREALIVFCKSTEKENLKNVSDLSARVLGGSTFVLGDLPDKGSSVKLKKGQVAEYSPVAVDSVSSRIRIAFQGKLLIDPSINKPSRPLNEGSILHEIFTHIVSTTDIANAINRLYLQGKISTAEKDKFALLITQAINDPQVSSWFTGDWTILNEAEIILPKGLIKRPDRVMMKNDRNVVIDYKFGVIMDPGYEKQIREYAQLIQDMGYNSVEAYLWYVKLGKVVSCN
jgi:ATP-dependent helicase/nuclease subunit A